LVTNEKAVAVFGFIHSGANIAVNEVAKEMGVPTMGTQTGAGDVTAKRYDIAFRTHAVDPPRAATWLGWAKKNGFKRMSIVAETTDYGIGLAKATEAQNKSMNIGLEIQTIMFDRTTTDLLPQLLQVKAFNPDCIINVGVGQPLDLMITQATTVGLLPKVPMVTSYDAPARPQHGSSTRSRASASTSSRSTPTSRSSATSASGSPKKYQEKFNEPPVYAALNAFANALVFAQGNRDREDDGAQGDGSRRWRAARSRAGRLFLSPFRRRKGRFGTTGRRR
jgi:branched-chain amino acid transport system substrate-binding protein